MGIFRKKSADQAELPRICVRKLKGKASRLSYQWQVLCLSAHYWLNIIWLRIKTLTGSGSGVMRKKISKERTCLATESDVQNDEIYQVYRIIPEVKGLPIVGTLFDLIAAGGAEQLHKYIDKRHSEYGEIFRERLGGGNGSDAGAYIFVSSASLMRSVFLYEGQNPRHPLPEAWILYNKHFQCQRGLFFMENEEWFQNRRMLNRFLLNGNLNWIDIHIETCTEKLITRWKHHTPDGNDDFHEIPDLEQCLYRWAVDVICAIMFGTSAVELEHIDAALETFSKIVRSVFEKSTPLMNFPPKVARLLRLRIWQEFEQNVTQVLRMGGEIIDMFLAQMEEHHSCTAPLPSVAENETLFHRLQENKTPMSLIKRIFVDLVIAAGDTTVYSTLWALYLLSQNDSLQRKVAQDVFLSVRKSPLVDGLIKETLRLYPVAPFIGRYLATDAVIDGYHISKDTLVLLSLYTSGRDEKHFPDPLTTQPERWLRNSSGQLAGVLQAHGSLPFAIGNRSCIGRKIAMKQMHSVLYSIVSHFQLHCSNVEPVESILRMVTVPNKTIKLEIKHRDRF